MASGAVTVACSVAKLTAATTSGAILVSFFSTRAAHAAQVMPLIDSSTVRAADTVGTSSIGPPRSGRRSSSRRSAPARPGAPGTRELFSLVTTRRKAHQQTTRGVTIHVVIKGSNKTLLSHAPPGERPPHDSHQQLR